jgi:hypothetical protein
VLADKSIATDVIVLLLLAQKKRMPAAKQEIYCIDWYKILRSSFC